jgi:hypothetical protein
MAAETRNRLHLCMTSPGAAVIEKQTLSGSRRFRSGDEGAGLLFGSGGSFPSGPREFTASGRVAAGRLS